MRTTLTIDDDVLLAAKERARRERRSVGEVVSELARQGLAHSGSGRSPGDDGDDDSFFGFRPLARRETVVTNELIDQLRDEEDL